VHGRARLDLRRTALRKDWCKGKELGRRLKRIEKGEVAARVQLKRTCVGRREPGTVLTGEGREEGEKSARSKTPGKESKLQISGM